MSNELELRMYGLVNYQLTGIQKGIQFLHAVVEYGQKFNDTELYKRWANEYKTVILLNGGTTNKKIINNQYFGTLNQYKDSLDKMGIPNAGFYEPDLGDQLTCFAFIVDERVFNKEKYPDFLEYVDSDYMFYDSLLNKEERYKEWIDMIGGETNIFLRDLLKSFKLA